MAFSELITRTSGNGHTPGYFKGRFPLSKWLRDNLPKFLLPDGETEIPVGPDPKRMQSGSTIPLMNEKEFKVFLETNLSPSLRLWTNCRTCGGDGETGMPGQARVCPTCGGYGRALTPFAQHIFETMAWMENPVPVTTAEECEEKNRRYWIEYEAEVAKEKLLFEMSGKAAEGQRTVALKQSEKIQKAYAEALAAIEAEKQKKLAGE